MARKPKHEEHVNHERWLVSYADFMTLLFAFFTSMYAISTVDAAKAGKMVFSTRAAFNLDFFPSDKPVLGESGQVQSAIKSLEKMPPPFERPMPVARRDKPAPKRFKPEQIKTLATDLQKFVDQKGLSGKLHIRLEKRGLVVSMAAAALFDSGSADMRKDSLPMLDVVVQKLMETGHPIMVEGHTDDRVAKGSAYRSNWDLSTARATRVVSYMVEEFAFPPDMLSAAGYASYHPVSDNETAEGRAANRRVDLVVLANGAMPMATAP